jgi:hypothetical protein
VPGDIEIAAAFSKDLGLYFSKYRNSPGIGMVLVGEYPHPAVTPAARATPTESIASPSHASSIPTS